MKPPPFDYVAATSVPHAISLLNDGLDARVLAGGQSLMPLLNLRLAGPELVVDIGRIPELNEITVADSLLVIGAGVTQTEAASHPQVVRSCPLLVAAISHIGHPQIRNRGTVCGSLAHNDPLAELPAVALALGATITAVGPNGARSIDAVDFFTGPFMTSLDPGELVTDVRFPVMPADAGWSIAEFATRTGDFATAGVVARLDVVDGAVSDARVVLFGLGPGPQRSALVEAAIDGLSEPVLGEQVLAALDASIEPGEDVHASAATRRELAAGLVVRSINEAWERSR